MSGGGLTVAGIALGSNMGDRQKHLRTALIALERTPGVTVLRRSTWYATEPVGGPCDQPEFLNGAALLETDLGAAGLLQRLHEIEGKHGRERPEPNGPRTLDLDLLWYGAEVSQDPALMLPHPRMSERLFVLLPLAEIAPSHYLEDVGRSVAERLEELRQASG